MRVSLRLLAAVVLAALCLVPTASAQVWGEITGRITSRASGEPIPGASVLVEGTNFGSAASADGRYGFRIPEGRYGLRITAVGYTTVRDSVTVRRGQPAAYSAALDEAVIEGGVAEVTGVAETGAGISTIDPRTVRSMPLPLADAIRAVQTEMGVTSNNELSNAFSVRGGSYDENQFFIDGFEVYRPLRISQGEQEGLGLVNGDLMDRMTLFAGGFPVRYGGKLASVLDATYARPSGRFSGTAYTSTLDAGAAVQGALSERVGLAVAARSARPQRFFAGQELKGAYDPDFRDAQGILTVDLAERHALRVIGLAARHRFRLAPQQRETTFGIFPNDVTTVAIDFEGVEEDGYDIAFGGALLTSRLGATATAEHRLSVFDIREFEGFEIASRTSLFRRPQRPDGPPTDLDRILEGTVRQEDEADNRIGQTVLTAAGRYLAARGRHSAEVGWQARALRFDDALSEQTRITGSDSLGNPLTVVARTLDDTAALSAFQGALWVEDAVSVLSEPGRLVLTPGLRVDYFDYNREWTLSPRLGASLRATETTTWTAALGVYHQAPTYRELRGEPAPGETIAQQLDGDIASQRATQAVLGLERFFPQRRVMLRAEAYGKLLANLISYDVENVRVAYSGDNDAEGYAAGFDVQLRGELVPGLPSWISYGFLTTRERFFAPEAPAAGASQAEQDAYAVALRRFENRGGGDTVARPTDRRHNLTLFVQDYIPGDDTWTLHLRTLFGTGLPTTARSAADEVNNVTLFEPGPRNALRLPTYYRFDMGATKRLRVGALPSGSPLELLATVEVLNVFDQTNVIAYSWVEQNSGTRRVFTAVPTRLTPRTFNVRLRLDF
jgi:hypothetical protein